MVSITVLARQSLELALFKTYTVPTISKLLCATGEFEKGKTAKRVEDTELILVIYHEKSKGKKGEDNNHLQKAGNIGCVPAYRGRETNKPECKRGGNCFSAAT